MIFSERSLMNSSSLNEKKPLDLTFARNILLQFCVIHNIYTNKHLVIIYAIQNKITMLIV